MTEHIDQAALVELKSIMEGDFDLLINTFVNDSTERIATIKGALAAADANAVRAAAHSFKGSALNICAPALSELCRELEARGRSGELSGALELVSAIESEFQTVRAALGRL
jgi:HPt (histidine-containing phosphotransfer) domain-containing protein